MDKQSTKFISCIEQTDGSIDITVPAAMSKEFKCLVKRAINTWPDQSHYIRDFADRLFKQDHLMQGNMLGDISKELGITLAKNSNGIVEATKPKKLCDGHPETCNCPQHG